MNTLISLAASSWIGEFFQGFIDQLKESFSVGDIGEEINEAILQVRDYLNIGGKQIPITDAIIVSWVVIAIMLILCLIGVHNMKLVPTGKQNVMEMLYELCINAGMSFGMNKKEAEYVTPMVGTFFFVIAGCNVCSVFGISPPAKNIAFPVALAIVEIIYVIGVSIKFIGVKNFFKSLMSPMPAMLPFKILDYIIKPVSLSLRLFGNVFGAFVFMEFLHIVIPIIIPGAFSLWFDITDGILQAVIFSYLTLSYIGESVEFGHEMEKEDAEKKAKAAAEAAA